MTGSQRENTMPARIDSIDHEVKKRLATIQQVKEHPSVAAAHKKDEQLRTLFRECPPVRLGQPLINTMTPQNEAIAELDHKLDETKKHVFQLLPSVIITRLKRVERTLNQLYTRYDVKSPSELIQAAYRDTPDYIKCQLGMQLLTSMYFSNMLNSQHKLALVDIYQNAFMAHQTPAVYALLDDVFSLLPKLQEVL